MKTLQNLIQELHARRDKAAKARDPTKYISAWIEDDLNIENNQKVKSLVVILRTTGCTWARKDYDNVETIGGCTMCGYVNDCPPKNEQINNEDILSQFKSALEKFQKKEFDQVKIFTSGSFLDNNELSLEVQKSILKIIADLCIKNTIVESRPQFITKNKLKEITPSISDAFQIAVGLESCNDKILKHSINKGFTFNDYCSAVKIARDFDIPIKTYLLLKPPFLSERDAVWDVLNSVRILTEKNLTNSISVNPVHIQKFTLVEYLFNHNHYRPPWLWSVVDVLQKGAELLKSTKIRLLSSPTAGGLRRGAHNCGKCDKNILDAIDNFSLDNDGGLLKDLECNCKISWKDILQLENIIKSTINLD